jgi:hypothetical protein
MAWIVQHLSIIWPALLLSWVLSFAIFETVALTHNGLTLSMFTWQVSEAWPPIIWLCGVLVGGLAVHFWWHWNPPSSGQLGPVARMMGRLRP